MNKQTLSPTYVASMSDSQKTKLVAPRSDFTYVQPGDIGANYVAGSEGQVKIIEEYEDIAGTILLNTTTFIFTDALYPTKPTSITTV